jgi:hypothetical protein
MVHLRKQARLGGEGGPGNAGRCGQHLDRHIPFQPQMPPRKDHPEGARAQLVAQFITGQETSQPITVNDHPLLPSRPNDASPTPRQVCTNIA